MKRKRKTYNINETTALKEKSNMKTTKSIKGVHPTKTTTIEIRHQVKTIKSPARISYPKLTNFKVEFDEAQ